MLVYHFLFIIPHSNLSLTLASIHIFRYRPYSITIPFQGTSDSVFVARSGKSYPRSGGYVQEIDVTDMDKTVKLLSNLGTSGLIDAATAAGIYLPFYISIYQSKFLWNFVYITLPLLSHYYIILKSSWK